MSDLKVSNLTDQSIRHVAFDITNAPQVQENDNWKREGRWFTPTSVVVTVISGPKPTTTRVQITDGTRDSNWSNSPTPGSAEPLSAMPQWLANVVAEQVS